MRLGISHHLGWAVAVTASADHEVVDRRRIELVEEGLPNAPVHHEGGPHPLHRRAVLTDAALADLVGKVRDSARRLARRELDALASSLTEPITSISLRSWPPDFPRDIAVQRRVPYESRADSVMYLEVLAEAGHERGWDVHLFDAKSVEAEATRVLGPKAHSILHGPRARLGPPWTKDHRVALAATVLANAAASGEG